MSKQKACKSCKKVYEGEKCPDCGGQEYTEDFKGRVIVFDTEKSEIAKKIKASKPGVYAIKTK